MGHHYIPQYYLSGFTNPAGTTFWGGWSSSLSRNNTGPYNSAGTATWWARARYYDTYYDTWRESVDSSSRQFFIVAPTATPVPTSTPTPCPRPPIPNLNSPAANVSFLTGSSVNLVLDSVSAVHGAHRDTECRSTRAHHSLRRHSRRADRSPLGLSG